MSGYALSLDGLCAGPCGAAVGLLRDLEREAVVLSERRQSAEGHLAYLGSHTFHVFLVLTIKEHKIEKHDAVRGSRFVVGRIEAVRDALVRAEKSDQFRAQVHADPRRRPARIRTSPTSRRARGVLLALSGARTSPSSVTLARATDRGEERDTHTRAHTHARTRDARHSIHAMRSSRPSSWRLRGVSDEVFLSLPSFRRRVSLGARAARFYDT